GQVIDTVSSTTGGCDTIRTLVLAVNPQFTTTVNLSVCANQLPYTWNGHIFTQAGQVIDTVTSTTGGCDTIRTLVLAVNPLLTSTVNLTVCANQLPYTWNGHVFTQAGQVIDTVTSTTGGCDTIRTLILAVNPLLTSTVNLTVCANQLPYTWNGHIFTQAGQVIDTVTSTTGGCDTIRTLVLAVNPLLTTTVNLTVCANQLPYTWNGHIFTQAGQVIDTVTSTTGG